MLSRLRSWLSKGSFADRSSRMAVFSLVYGHAVMCAGPLILILVSVPVVGLQAGLSGSKSFFGVLLVILLALILVPLYLLVPASNLAGVFFGIKALHEGDDNKAVGGIIGNLFLLAYYLGLGLLAALYSGVFPSN